MYFVVPPSSIKNLSESATVIPVPSVAPSTCTAAPDTLSAVDIVFSLLSAIDPASIVLLTVPESPDPTKVPDATGKTTTALLLAEWGWACNVCACALEDSQ